MKVAILGLSITSSWGNGHATNYRALARAMAARGDQVTFLERERSWYADHRDLADPPWCTIALYGSVRELQRSFASAVHEADLVIIGSFVPEGVAVTSWVLSTATGAVAFYDIDTPVTLEKLRRDDHEYLSAELVPCFDLYLSFTAGSVLHALREEFAALRPVPFYCFVDPDHYQRIEAPQRWAINYLGTYDRGRQPALEALLLAPAQRLGAERFCVAGPMYPAEVRWPANVERIDHLPPAEHPGFYCSTAFTLNVTRSEMRAVGYSPSVRLFEAAACGAAIISDRWPGIETIFAPREEIFLADTTEQVLELLGRTEPARRERVGAAARRRVLAEHTAQRRAEQLHELVREAGRVAAA